YHYRLNPPHPPCSTVFPYTTLFRSPDAGNKDRLYTAVGSDRHGHGRIRPGPDYIYCIYETALDGGTSKSCSLPACLSGGAAASYQNTDGHTDLPHHLKTKGPAYRQDLYFRHP